MKPQSIRETLDRQGVRRPNLRVLTPEDTAKLELPSWTVRRDRSRRFASGVVLICAVVICAALAIVDALGVR